MHMKTPEKSNKEQITQWKDMTQSDFKSMLKYLLKTHEIRKSNMKINYGSSGSQFSLDDILHSIDSKSLQQTCHNHPNISPLIPTILNCKIVQQLESFYTQKIQMITKLNQEPIHLNSSKNYTNLQSSTKLINCLHYEIDHHHLYPYANTRYNAVGQEFDGIIVKSQLPKSVTDYYKLVKSGKKGRDADNINFKQGFLASWGYLYYVIQDRMFLINPCPELFPELHSSRLTSNIAHTNITINNNNITQTINFKLPQILINLIQTNLTLSQFYTSINIHSDSQPPFQQQDSYTIIIMIHPYFLDLYAVPIKKYEILEKLIDGNITDNKKQRLIDNDKHDGKGSANMYNIFHDLHMRYRLDCAVPVNVVFDVEKCRLFYNDEMDKERLYCVELGLKCRDVSERRWKGGIKLKMRKRQVRSKISREKASNNGLSIRENIKKLFTVNPTTKQKLQQIFINSASRAPQSSYSHSNNNKNNKQQQIIPSLFSKTCNFLNTLIQHIKHKQAHETISTRLCSTNSLLFQLSKTIKHRLTATSNCSEYHKIYQLKIMKVVGNGKENGKENWICWVFQLNDSDCYPYLEGGADEKEKEKQLDNKNCNVFNPVGFTIQNCETNEFVQICLLHNNGSKDIYRVFLLKQQAQMQHICHIQPKQSTITIQNITSKNTHNTSKQTINSTQIIKQCNNNLLNKNMIRIQQSTTKTNTIKYYQTHLKADQHYFHKYYDPIQITKNNKTNITTNIITDIITNRRQLYIHGTNYGYQVIIQLRKIDKILSLIFQQCYSNNKMNVARKINQKFEQIFDNQRDCQIFVGVQMLTILMDVTNRYTIYCPYGMKIRNQSDTILSITLQQLITLENLIFPNSEKVLKICENYLINLSYIQQCEINNKKQTEKQLQKSGRYQQQTGIKEQQNQYTYSSQKLQKTYKSQEKQQKQSNKKQRDAMIKGKNKLQTILMTYVYRLMGRYWDVLLADIDIDVMIRQVQRVFDVCAKVNRRVNGIVLDLGCFDREQGVYQEVSQFIVVESCEKQKSIQQLQILQTPKKRNKDTPPKISTKKLSLKNQQPIFMNNFRQLIYFIALLSISMPTQILKHIKLRHFYTKSQTILLPSTLTSNSNSNLKVNQINSNEKQHKLFDLCEKYLFIHYVENHQNNLQCVWKEVCGNFITKAFVKACRFYEISAELRNKSVIVSLLFKEYELELKQNNQSVICSKKQAKQAKQMSIFQEMRNKNQLSIRKQDKNSKQPVKKQIKRSLNETKKVIVTTFPSYLLAYLKDRKNILLDDLIYIYQQYPAAKDDPQNNKADNKHSKIIFSPTRTHIRSDNQPESLTDEIKTVNKN